MITKNEKLRIGIPRALLYHYYTPWWEKFWQLLGAEVVVSPPTTKEILDMGVSLAAGETCLPVKVYYGHAAWLIPKIDALYVPRLVSVEKKKYICPKLMGLPDMLRSALKPGPKIIDTTINLYRGEDILRNAYKDMAARVGISGDRVYAAFDESFAYYKQHVEKKYRSANWGKKPKLGVVSHPYLIHDRHLNMRIVDKIRAAGGEVILPENLPPDQVEETCKILPKRLFWTLGSKVMGTVLSLMDREDVGGIIHLTAFGCGPDSMVGDLAERYAKRKGKPFLLLTLDEHTGEAGINTRLEAFMDIISRRYTA